MRSDCEEHGDGGTVPFLCECGDVGCERCVPLTRETYAELEEKPPHLALAPGHELEHRSGSGKRDRR